MLTQQLISILNEQYQGFKKLARPVRDKDGKLAHGSDGKPIVEVIWEKDGRPNPDLTNMRKLLENLVFNATVLNDQSAINAIFDRVEGKPAQAIVAEDENGNRLAATRFVLEFDPASPAPARPPTVTPDLQAATETANTRPA